MTDTTSPLNTPWTLHFELDGTEDVATVLDADGSDLAYSRPFWRPVGDDPTPPTLAAMRAMNAAPKLLAACETALAELRVRCGYKGDESAYKNLLAAIAEATDDSTGRVA